MLLNEKLMERGCSKQQLSSKVVDIVIEVLANDNDLFDRVAMEEAKFAMAKANAAQKEADAMLSKARNAIRDNEEYLRQLKQQRSELQVKIEECKLVTEETNEMLRELELPESRDRLRLYELYRHEMGGWMDRKTAAIKCGAILASAIQPSRANGFEPNDREELCE